MSQLVEELGLEEKPVCFTPYIWGQYAHELFNEQSGATAEMVGKLFRQGFALQKSRVILPRDRVFISSVNTTP